MNQANKAVGAAIVQTVAAVLKWVWGIEVPIEVIGPATVVVVYFTPKNVEN